MSTAAYLDGGPSDGKAMLVPDAAAEAGHIKAAGKFLDVYWIQGAPEPEPAPGTVGKYVRTEQTLEIWKWQGDD